MRMCCYVLACLLVCELCMRARLRAGGVRFLHIAPSNSVREMARGKPGLLRMDICEHMKKFSILVVPLVRVCSLHMFACVCMRSKTPGLPVSRPARVRCSIRLRSALTIATVHFFARFCSMPFEDNAQRWRLGLVSMNCGEGMHPVLFVP